MSKEKINNISKENVNKTLDAFGKGFQAAGGEVSLGRIGATVLHAGASLIGEQDRTRELLDRSSRGPITLTDADLRDLETDNKALKL